MAERVLVVEDESTLCGNLVRALTREGYEATGVTRGADALREIEASPFDLVLTDLRLPDIDGFAVLDHVRKVAPETTVLLMTAYASIDSAVEALRRGAHDYLLKPISLADAVRKIGQAVSMRRLGRENARLRAAARGGEEPIALLQRGGRAMGELAELIAKVASSSSNVLVLGESGTGKELVAHAVHDLSDRREGPFVSVNVSAIPDTLVESYLFGHERGAFTGADKRREGLFRAASGGTLFLDEIGELPLALQAKLLRAVESKEVLPVGSDRGIKVDTRIVAATHRDLLSMVAEGRFRQDLLYRLQVVQLRIPPLRERKGDIPMLAAHFVELHARAQKKNVRDIDDAALSTLASYRWPGNVRELSNVIERAVILCTGGRIMADDLPSELRGAESAPISAPALREETPLDDDACDLERSTLAFQRAHVARVLSRVGGNRDAAAKLLGLSAATLYRQLQRLGLKGSRGDQEMEAR